jgi:hypothetical protein
MRAGYLPTDRIHPQTTAVEQWLGLACFLERLLQSGDQLIAGQPARLALHRYNRLVPGAKRALGFRSLSSAIIPSEAS